MSNGLYPGVLFHFTKYIKNFRLILQDRCFKVSYAREQVYGKTYSRDFGAPMVSFCDLRLSELRAHTKNYGNYGIGLSKDWAYKNGLNPVLYLNQNCAFINNFMDALDGIHKNVISTENIYSGNNSDVLEESYHKILRTYMYAKNYEGDLYRSGVLKKKDYRFANEREWRYVPDNTDFVPQASMTGDWKSIWNAKISNRDLKFGLEDIAYIIIGKDIQRSNLIDHIEKRLGVSYKKDVLQKLSSRIMTVEQIQRDI